MTPVERVPQPVGAALSLAAGVVAVLLVASDPEPTRAVFMQAFGLALFLVGSVYYRAGRSATGMALGIAGGSFGLAAVGLGWSHAGSTVAKLELLPGMVGLLVLAGGVTGVRRGWERRLVSVGTAGLLIGLLTNGIVRDTPEMVLFAAVATVLAWDTAEQAVNLGEQVGTRAVTWSAELTHVVGSIVVGAAAVALALGTYRFGVEDVPLAGVVLLAMGGVILMAAHYS